jgi:lipoprotein-anchoring transpeptidase ErfK/SrfK
MFKQLSVFVCVVSGLAFSWAPAASASYGSSLCKQADYQCVTVKKGQSWQSLFANSRQRDLVMRLNRLNTRLKPGQVIAVPKKLSGLDLDDIAPFPQEIEAPGRTTVVVDQKQLAWGAYSEDGELVKWGPMSAGKKWCADIKEKCHTPAGKYTVFRKEGAECKSSSFPVDKPGGGAPMPYCVFFNGGIAFHGSDTLPGYNASHGCVRMYTEDARWLNTQFIEMGRTQVLVDKNLPKASSSSSAPRSAWNSPGQRKGGVDGFAWH